MSKFKFTSLKKSKFNPIKDDTEYKTGDSVHTEVFFNNKMIIEGCKSIVEYQDNYIKLKLKKGFISILGTEFLISEFAQQKIIIKGNIKSIEFCV